MKITKPYYIIFLLFIFYCVFRIILSIIYVETGGFSLETPTSNTSTTTTDT